MEKYWVIRKVIGWIAHAAAHIKVVGAEHIPQEGGCLVVTNHISRLDTPTLLVASRRRIYALVASEYRKFPGLNWLLNATDSIWIRRYEFDREALLQSLEVLKRGDVLGVAPEGTRSRDGILQKAKPGIAFLAARTGVPLVPVAITGTQFMSRDFMRLRRMRISVTFGESFRLPRYGKLSTDELMAATDMIMQRIAILLPPDYRGVYADVAV